MQKQVQDSLERVLNYLEHDEQKDFAEEKETTRKAEHIYNDIHALRGWLNKSVVMSGSKNG